MSKKNESTKTTDALDILEKMAGDTAEMRQLMERARVNAMVAQLIYAARAKAGLSQADLAAKVGTKQSVISRLEDADYEGHSLAMLQRIAVALGCSVEIRFAEKAISSRKPAGLKTSARKRRETALVHG